MRRDGIDQTAIVAVPEMLTRAIGWLDGNLAFFDDRRLSEDIPQPGFSIAPLLELLVLCRCLRRCADPGLDAFVDRCLDLAAEVVARTSVAAGLHRVDATFRFHVWLISMLTDLRRPHPGLCDLAQRLFDADCGIDSPMRPPAARLELHYAATLGGFRHALPDPHASQVAVLYGTGPSEAFVMGDADVYAVTHAFFYVTDFGADRRGLPAGPGGSAALGSRVLALLGRYLCTGNLDVTAELLFCAHVLGMDDDIVRCGWRRLSAAQRTDGAIPGSYQTFSVPPAVRSSRVAAFDFLANYHTTLVTALSLAVIESSGRE